MMKTKQVILETNTENRCTQLHCAFYISGGCKNCASCNSEPYHISKDCSACYHCINTPGVLRFIPEETNERNN